MTSLDLALIGNGTISGLVDPAGRVVWTCFPRFDGDPAFCSLLRDPGDGEGFGYFAIELNDAIRYEQEYLTNTAILVTRQHDQHGSCVEITDFMPRFRNLGRNFSPMTLIRQVKRIAGTPRIRIRVRPTRGYGRFSSEKNFGSNHIRYTCSDLTLRLTTDASINAILEENAFFLDESVTLILGHDETVHGSVLEIGRHFYEETAAYWRDWVRYLGVPFEWQDAVIRAAITLKLNAVEDTGAIVAAMTTSIPEAAGSSRTWDYRYCWLRDAYFVVDALNRLGATRTMERYLGYILNIVADAEDKPLQPVYGISGRTVLDEQVIDSLPGYRGMGPVRIGNQAHQQVQHDVYGSVILAATHVFFDRRLIRRGDVALFGHLETLGNRALRLFNEPDAGLWELRGAAHVHTFSGVMSWAGCDRLARIAAHLGLDHRAAHWRKHAAFIHSAVCERSWSPSLNSFVATVGGTTLDASLLLLNEVGFLAADDSRFASTVDAVERALRRGDLVYRYVEKDDFGEPENAFLVCTFWYINALAVLGRRDEARRLFQNVLDCRNVHGLLAEHIDPRTREQWGNFVQTYSMVGLIRCAILLSDPWVF